MTLTIPPPRKSNQVVEIHLNTLQDINDLINDLQRAKHLAKRTGGMRTIGRRNPDGTGVAFHIQLPM